MGYTTSHTKSFVQKLLQTFRNPNQIPNEPYLTSGSARNGDSMNAKDFAQLPPEGVAKMAQEIVFERKKTSPKVSRPRDEKDQQESFRQLENPKLSVSVREGFRMRGEAIACDLCVYGEKWAKEHSPECETLQPLVLIRPDNYTGRVEVFDGTYKIAYTREVWRELWKGGILESQITSFVKTADGNYANPTVNCPPQLSRFIQKAVQMIPTYLEIFEDTILEEGESSDEE